MGRNFPFGPCFNWLEDEPLFQLAKQPVENQLLSSKVSCYWETGRGWKWHLLAHLLPTTSFLKLASMRIRHNREIPDQIGWLKPNVDRFAASSA